MELSQCYAKSLPYIYSSNPLTLCLKHQDEANIDGMVQGCSISSVLAMEISQSYTEPLEKWSKYKAT